MTKDDKKSEHENSDLIVELDREEKRNHEEEKKAKEYLLKLIDNS
jgi:hypothetical protein